MSRARLPYDALLALTWGGSAIAALVLFRSGALERAASWVVAVEAIAALVLVSLLAAGRLAGIRASLDRMTVALAGPALLGAVAGGLASLGVGLVALVVLGFAWRRSLAWGVVAATVAMAVLVGAELALGRALQPTTLIQAGALLFGLALVPQRAFRRAAEESADARRRLDRVEGYMADRRVTPYDGSVVAADLRSDAQLVLQHAEGLRELEVLDRFLRDIRDALGADEVIFWRWNEARQTQRPASWSTEGVETPSFFVYEAWAPLVKWAAEGGLVQTVGDGESVSFLSAPVHGRTRLLGVLSVSAHAGLNQPRDEAKSWIARYAEHVALLVELLTTRREHRSGRVGMQAIIRAAERIQDNKETEEAARAICDTAIEITSATRAAVVEWDSESATGSVVQATDNYGVPKGHRFGEDSVVGAACARGLPVLNQEGRRFERGAMYGAGELQRVLGSIAIVPLRKLGQVRGAIVLESPEPDAISAAEMHLIRTLAAVALNSLELAKDREAVARSAYVDPLTGLWNRRYFDEQLRSVLAQTDRHGYPSSLILVDIDFFKRVNDSYGHEAGDAVLRSVAQVLQEGVREADICARFGGEEIAILLPHTDLSGARELAERLRHAVEIAPVHFGGVEIRVTASFGVASYPESTNAREGVFPLADKALYEAKADGRNRVKFAVL